MKCPECGEVDIVFNVFGMWVCDLCGAEVVWMDDSNEVS